MSAPAQVEEQIEGMIEKLLSIQNQVQCKLDEIKNLKVSNEYGRRQKECLNFDSICLTLKEYKDKYELSTLLFLKEEEKKLKEEISEIKKHLQGIKDTVQIKLE